MLRTCCPEGAEQLSPLVSSWPPLSRAHSEGGQSLWGTCRHGMKGKLGIHCSGEHPRCLRGSGGEAIPCPTPIQPSPSLIAESHLQVPLALSSTTVTLWAALALLSLPHATLEAQLGGLIPFFSGEHSFIWRAKLLSESIGSRVKPLERAPFCPISWIRKMCRGQSRSLRNVNYFSPSSCHGA